MCESGPFFSFSHYFFTKKNILFKGVRLFLYSIQNKEHCYYYYYDITLFYRSVYNGSSRCIRAATLLSPQMSPVNKRNNMFIYTYSLPSQFSWLNDIDGKKPPFTNKDANLAYNQLSPPPPLYRILLWFFSEYTVNRSRSPVPGSILGPGPPQSVV